MDERYPHLRTVADQDGGVILDLRRGTVTLLNPTGAFVWAKLSEGLAVDAIVALLAKEAGEALDLVFDDVSRFVAELNQRHLEDRIRG